MPPTTTTATATGAAAAVPAVTPEHAPRRFPRVVRVNPRSDRFPVLAFHHVELWCADAASAAGRFAFALGAPLAARSDLSTGNSAHASLLLRSGALAFLFTAPYAPPQEEAASATATASIPSFSAPAARAFSAAHGLAVRAVGLRVADAAEAFRASVAGGARPAFAPANLSHGYTLAEVELYGDVVLRFISYPDNNEANLPFLPGFEAVNTPGAVDYGLTRFDHVVGNVPEMAPVIAYMKGFLGFHEFAEFTAEDVGTTESGLNSVVLANNSENVLLPLNEPVHGTKRRSQIQTYLDYHGGPGVQHIALASADVLRTLREMRARTPMGGFEFMAPPQAKYYEGVRRIAGDVLSEEQIKECQELGVLVDRDDQGVLLQIFTKPVGDRPTFFLEMIQRIGCMEKDEVGQEYQKGGCGGFGKGNFSELFKSIEGVSVWHRYLSIVVVSIGAILFALTSFSDPGTVTSENVSQYVSAYPFDNIIFVEKECSTCKIIRPARAKHCRICDRCVARFDHHCGWMNNCIGEKNTRYFVAFLVWHFLLCMYGAVILAFIIAGELKVKKVIYILTVYYGVDNSFSGLFPHVAQWLLAVHNTQILLAVFLGIIALLLGGFCAYHVHLCLSNTTTNESFKWQDYIFWMKKENAARASAAVLKASISGASSEVQEPAPSKWKTFFSRSQTPAEEPVVKNNIYDVGWIRNLWEVIVPLSERRSFSRRKSD